VGGVLCEPGDQVSGHLALAGDALHRELARGDHGVHQSRRLGERRYLLGVADTMSADHDAVEDRPHLDDGDGFTSRLRLPRRIPSWCRHLSQ